MLMSPHPPPLATVDDDMMGEGSADSAETENHRLLLDRRGGPKSATATTAMTTTSCASKVPPPSSSFSSSYSPRDAMPQRSLDQSSITSTSCARVPLDVANNARRGGSDDRRERSPAATEEDDSGLDDLDLGRWAMLLCASTAVRTLVQHPLVLLTVRKQAAIQTSHVTAMARGIVVQQGWRGFFRGFGCTLMGSMLTESLYIFLYEVGRQPAAASVASANGSSPNPQALSEESGVAEGRSGRRSHLEPSSSSFFSPTTTIEPSPVSLDPGHLSSPTLIVPPPRQHLRNAAAAFASDGFTTMLMCPFAVVANRQMTAGFGLCKDIRYEGAMSVYRQLRRREGAMGLFRGLSASLMLAPCSALWWALYHPLRDGTMRMATTASSSSSGTGQLAVGLTPATATSPWRSSMRSVASAPLLHDAVAGYVTSVVVMTLFNPLMVIRLRMQVLSDSASCDSTTSSIGSSHTAWREPPRSQEAPRHDALRRWTATLLGGAQGPSALGPSSRPAVVAGGVPTLRQVARDVWRREGVRGFFKGCSVNVLTAAVDGILLATTYEMTKRYATTTTRGAANDK